jgi:hypothetical protein
VRVVVLFTCWMIFWMSLGTAIGAMWGVPKTGAVDGFAFALLATFSWPWIVPRTLDEWMDHSDLA